ncbi:DUF397 domain-containing protein [Kineosporia sp. NBRC 101731]|uniref:DUF397 domain-containing protein n=1 Tax=Kineosporia sp. NBRC 101731 TaxID=3032199 RepID=UPI002557C35C|nr:DUF397 domain-containing protein [Kineosporia sp. NBRC 101731]
MNKSVSVDADLEWTKSSFSGINGCVEAALAPDGSILIRDSKNPTGGHLSYNEFEWRSFLAGLSRGEFDFLLPRNE